MEMCCLLLLLLLDKKQFSNRRPQFSRGERIGYSLKRYFWINGMCLQDECLQLS